MRRCTSCCRAIGCAKIWRPPYGLEGPMPSEFLVALLGTTFLAICPDHIWTGSPLTTGGQSVINSHMTVIIIILLAVALLILWAVIVNSVSKSSLQFPTSYTLLKSSPSIVRREMWALRVIVVLMAVFLLLLLTSTL